jgi:hypothetical protein
VKRTIVAKTVKTGNPDRRSGKAWGKNHAAKVKVLTTEQQEHKAHKDAERERRRVASQDRGSNVTMPKISWDWCAEATAGRMTGTRRLRVVESVFAKER